jgi:sulfotransferase family protein
MDAMKTGRLPDFLIVGAGKAGTTSLAAWLRAHPQVFVPAEKELHFFDRSWDRGVDWYRAQFAEAPADATAGEATATYMIHSVYIDRMAAVVPDARLIAMLRNPVDRARSQYDHMVARGARAWEPYRTFDGRSGPRSFGELIELELELDPSDWRTSGMCLARGRYVKQLQDLAARFDRERIQVALYDDLVDDPPGMFAAVCGFLGVDEGIRPEAVGQAFDPLALMGPGVTEDSHDDLLVTAPEGPRTAREAIPAPLRARLVEHFRPYNDELAEWLGVDLSAWNR